MHLPMPSREVQDQVVQLPVRLDQLGYQVKSPDPAADSKATTPIPQSRSSQAVGSQVVDLAHKSGSNHVAICHQK